MYKKKLGVRVITAITVGSLLCSNASMAMASPDVSSIIEDYEEKEEQESEAEKLEETEAVEETEAETEAVEETEAETEAVEETEAETEAVEETEAETEAEEETEAETEAEEETEAETEAVEETEIETEAVSKFTEAEETETQVEAANSKDVTVQITYYDSSITTGNNQIGTGYEHVTVTEGEEPIVLKASELDNITIDGVEYQVSAEAMDLTVEYRENVNEYRWAVAMEKVETNPDEKETLATLKVTYKDGETVVGEEELSAMGIDGKDHTFTADALTIPEGYELAADFADVTVKYGETASVEVAVKAISNPDVPVEMANATLHISYAYNGREISSQDITVVGKKGESYTFTAENVALQVPNGYKLSKEFADVTVVFSETKNIELAVSYLGGGSGSGGSGSSSGGGSSSSGSSSSSHQLESGRWIQDSTGWWYSFNNGTYAKSGWYALKWENKIDWYYFNGAGYLISGWFEDKGLKYYLHDLHDGTFGRMYTGWNKIGGQWYYFNDTTEGVLGALKADVQVPEELLNK